MDSPYIILTDISKSIDGQSVLKHVNLEIRKGTAHILWGANGAGKSVLIRILCGTTDFDEGCLTIGNHTYYHCAPFFQKSSLIAVSPQTNCITEELTVFQNLFMDASVWFQTWEQYFDRHVPDYLLDFTSCLRPYLHEKAKVLSSAQLRILQLARTILTDREILIFDEPFIYLPDYAKQMLLDLIKELKARGKTIIAISHACQWFIDFADYITMLKDGSVWATDSLADYEPEEVLDKLADAIHLKAYPKLPVTKGKTLLEVDFLSDQYVKDICFSLHEGEILGITGTLASGKSQIGKLLVGGASKQYGRISYENRTIQFHSPSDAISQQIYYIPQHRDQNGLFLNHNIRFNIVDVNTLNLGCSSSQQSAALSKYYQGRLRIKAEDCYEKVSSLSNGNRQKVMLGRAFCNQPKVFILDEPSSEVDAAGKSEIYNIMNQLLLKGVGILLISSDFTEIAALCDAALFMHKGHCIQKLEGEDLSADALYHLSHLCIT